MWEGLFLPDNWRQCAADLAFVYHWTWETIYRMTPGEFLIWHDSIHEVLARNTPKG